MYRPRCIQTTKYLFLTANFMKCIHCLPLYCLKSQFYKNEVVLKSTVVRLSLIKISCFKEFGESIPFSTLTSGVYKIFEIYKSAREHTDAHLYVCVYFYNKDLYTYNFYKKMQNIKNCSIYHSY